MQNSKNLFSIGRLVNSWGSITANKRQRDFPRWPCFDEPVARFKGCCMTLSEQLENILGGEAVSTLESDRWACARDLSVRGVLKARAGLDLSLPSAVVWPATVKELRRLIGFAREHNFALAPFGAGSGVVGALGGESRTIVVDMKRFQSLELDAEAGLCRVGAGVIGEHLER